MAVRIQRWLEAQGFSSNPFEFWEADRETTLSSYFVRAEWFDALRGDTKRPRSAVLFAPRGHGKSSHRLEIARLCGEASATDPALIVQITEYDWIMAEGLERVTSQRYLQYVARRAALALWDGLQRSQGRRAAFAADARHLLRLHGLLRWSAGAGALLPQLDLPAADLPALALQYRLNAPPDTLPEALVDAAAGYYGHAQQTEILGDLVQLAQAARYASIYVLVDRVDEDALTEHNTDATLRLIQPLISNLHMIEFPGLAFKFFLPDHIGEAMLQQRVSRIEERVPTYTLTWHDSDLHELLALRLRYYSRLGATGDIGAVNAFQDLCERGCDADAMLVAAAQGSPRRLIMLANKVIEAHCQVADDLESKIGAATFRDKFQSSIPRLYLDSAGYIWLDRKRQPTQLTKLPRKLLEFLWENRTRYVSKDEVERVLYAYGERTPDALYKVVKRLRKQIEPRLVNSKNYIDFVEGHGYRLQNFEDSSV
ncbi:MAG: helix-turn-helix domain-containing protein [Kouleothrix sp.]|nr:helix-turn-helix domain-containing protein [Kouleothrix sp.]